MKKLILSSVLALSGTMAMVGCTQASAVSESQTTTATKMQNYNQGKSFKEGRHWGRQGGFEKLNLTAEQKAQMQALRETQKQKYQNNREQYRVQMQLLQTQTQALINSPTLDTTALNRLADQQAALSKQRFIERIQSQHAMAKILTAEQKAELEKMREDRKAKFNERMDKRAARVSAQ